MAEVLRVEGLQEFIKALGVLPANWKVAEQLFLKLASRSLLVEAKDLASRYAAINGVYRLASRDIKTGGVGTVKYGGHPYDMGAEYGSYTHPQFPTWRGNGDSAGYFFWPAVRAYRNEHMVDDYFKQVWATVKEAFPDY